MQMRQKEIYFTVYGIYILQTIDSSLAQFLLNLFLYVQKIDHFISMHEINMHERKERKEKKHEYG